MGATEMLIDGFRAIVSEHEAMQQFGNEGLKYRDIIERLNRLAADIHENTGFRYEAPELMTLFQSYTKGVMEVAA